MKLEIGKRKLIEITQEELLELCVIEKVHSFFEYWGRPIVTDFDKNMFSDTICIDYHSFKIEDGFQSKTISFYFNHQELNFHWNMEGRMTQRNRLRLESYKYLISKGFDLPIY